MVKVLRRGVERFKRRHKALYYAEIKIMINCDEIIERKGLRKVVNMRRGLKQEKTRRKEKQGCKDFS